MIETMQPSAKLALAQNKLTSLQHELMQTLGLKIPRITHLYKLLENKDIDPDVRDYFHTELRLRELHSQEIKKVIDEIDCLIELLIPGTSLKAVMAAASGEPKDEG